MFLELEHLGLSRRSCEDCLRYWYKGESISPEIDKRTGEPVSRPTHLPPDCHLEKGCPKGCYRHPKKPDTDNSLTGYNRRAYQHYLICKATGEWPRSPDGSVDETVKRNAMLISQAEAMFRRMREQRLISATESTGKLISAFLEAMAAR